MSSDPRGDDAVTDAHRDAAIDALRTAAGDGRIDLEEFGDRAGVVYAAVDLDAVRSVLADLPPSDLPVVAPQPASHPWPAPAPAPRDQPAAQNVVAIMSGAHRKGTWRAGGRINAVAVMGGVKLDFRNATLSSATIEITAVSIMGSVEVIVPDGVPIEVDGFVLMGGVDDRTRESRAPGAPLIRSKAAGLMGGVVIRHPRKRRRSQGAVDGGRGGSHGLPHVPHVPVPPTPVPPTPRLPWPFPQDDEADEADEDDGLDAAAPRAEPQPEASMEEPASSRSPESPLSDVVDGGTATLLFTDVIESTVLADELGDQRWFRVLRQHNELLREQFERHRGREIKGQGDGFMVAFSSARRGLQCAIDIQRAVQSQRWSDPEVSYHLRIGLHTGEVITAEGDLFGRNVIMASRIAALAGTDEILASDTTRQLADGTMEVEFGSTREVELRGLAGRWTVHPVEWR